ncbi:MAG: transketolase C-terminal domain-containing protein, partial [Candidatus Zixiibacteriota bacterium]
VLSNPGNFAVIMGRSVVSMVSDEAGKPYFGEGYEYRYGRMEQIRLGESVALVSAGNMLWVALDAYNTLKDDGKNISLISVSDWSDIHPDDLNMLSSYKNVIVLEDHNVKTGLGTAIADALVSSGLTTKLSKMGVTRYGSSGKPLELYKLLGIDTVSVVEKIKLILK